MEKINIGAELNPIYGRIGAAEHIYDYANRKTQREINTMVLNELYSYDLGLRITTVINAIDGNTNIAEFTGSTVNTKIKWNIRRKHGLDYILDNTTCPDGLLLEIDNLANSTLTELDGSQLWSQIGETKLTAGLGVTTATMTMNMTEGFTVEQQASFYLLPPIYYGFSELEEIGNPANIFEDSKKVAIDASGRYVLVNETGAPAYFYICIPHTLGISEIEVSSSGFRVPFDKVIMENFASSGLDTYDLWRNPTGSMIWNGSEIVYDVK